jgi:hypothetical protein
MGVIQPYLWRRPIWVAAVIVLAVLAWPPPGCNSRGEVIQDRPVMRQLRRRVQPSQAEDRETSANIESEEVLGRGAARLEQLDGPEGAT